MHPRFRDAARAIQFSAIRVLSRFGSGNP